MAACAHGADLDVCKHIPKEVAKEFNQADKRKAQKNRLRDERKHGTPWGY